MRRAVVSFRRWLPPRFTSLRRDLFLRAVVRRGPRGTTPEGAQARWLLACRSGRPTLPAKGLGRC
jgi:hypothetical protein